MSLGLQEKKKINPAPAATNHHSISSLESISYSPDVGTLILREVPNCRLSQTSVNKPASHHLAKLISFWNPVFYQEYALIVVFSVTGFCLTQRSIRLEKKKKPLHSKVSYRLLVLLPPLSGCLILEPFCLLFLEALGRAQFVIVGGITAEFLAVLS